MPFSLACHAVDKMEVGPAFHDVGAKYVGNSDAAGIAISLPAWLSLQPLPMDERIGIDQRLHELDRLAENLQQVERVLAQSAIHDDRLRKLLTIIGINTTVAIGLISAIGDIARFRSPEKLVSYFGFNPSAYQSGLQPVKHGHISKRGRSYARAMLVEAAWAAAQTAGPVRAFFLRVRDRRGQQIAAVATARKLAIIV